MLQGYGPLLGTPNGGICYTFRLPNLEEKAKDSELSDLIASTIEDASPPLFTLHNIIGNFFKPSAVLAALGGPDNIQNYVSGETQPHLWSPASPSLVESNFNTLRTRVLQDSSDQAHLQSHIAQRWFPKHLHKLDTDDYWFTSRSSAPPPVQTALSATYGLYVRVASASYCSP